MSLKMKREDLHAIPEFALPAEYSFKYYESGFEQAWLDIHLLADQYHQFDKVLYDSSFGRDKELIQQRQMFIINKAGRAIGTASAWFVGDDPKTRTGLVHWVAIIPEEQGKGLAKPLMTAICRRLKELGHTEVELNTHSLRLPAIQLYLKFGFVPVIQTAEEAVIWQQIRQVDREK